MRCWASGPSAERAEAVTKAAEARHRLAMGAPALKTKGVDAELLADVGLDQVTLHLARPRQRIAQTRGARGTARSAAARGRSAGGAARGNAA